jgi:hypothetical protein
MRRLLLIAMVCVAGTASVWLIVAAQQPGAVTDPTPIDQDDIAGTVTSPRGPEAGVWVIAETKDLPTKFRKIVVTMAFTTARAVNGRARNLLKPFIAT